VDSSDPKTIEPARGGEGPELLRKLSEWTANAARFWSDDFKRMREDCEYAYGRVEDEDEDGEVRVNIVHSTIQGLMPHVYARNPEVAFTPAEGVEQSQLAAVKAFASVLQTAVQRSFREARLKRVMKAGTRTALTRSLQWFKVQYQREYGTDPVMQSRIADAQDNLAHLDRMLEELQADATGAGEGRESTREELEQTISALRSEGEVLMREGLVIDRVQPDHLILDPALPDLEAWRQGRRMTELVWMARDEAEVLAGRKLDSATTWTWRQVKQSEEAAGEKRPDSGRYTNRDVMVKCLECWDRGTLTVYTWFQGEQQWARDPYIPQRQGEQWYPYFDLAFHPADGQVMPLNLVRLLKSLQDEYNRTRTQQDEHRQVSIPTWVADASTDRSTLRRHRDAVLGEVVLVDAKGRPIQNVIAPQSPPPYNPALYDTSPIRVDIETTSGLSDAQRGAIARAKTLGEAEIMQAGVQGRADELRDTVEDCIEAIAEYASQILVLELTPQAAARLAGPSALLSWPAADKRALFSMVNTDIRAGTAGRPNKAQEQKVWAELLPIIERLQDMIVQMAAAGVDPSHKVELLRQTVRRFDESLEIDELLPMQIMAFIRQQEALRAQGMPPALAGLLSAAPGNTGMGADNVVPFPGAPPAAGAV